MEGLGFLKQWHAFFSAVSVILVGIHIGLHGTFIRNAVKKFIPLPQRIAKVVRSICRAIEYSLS